jgi:hypothetical protein
VVEQSETPFERKWTVLFDPVADYHALWEPLYALRGVRGTEGQSEEDKQEWAERAIRELRPVRGSPLSLVGSGGL